MAIYKIASVTLSSDITLPDYTPFITAGSEPPSHFLCSAGDTQPPRLETLEKVWNIGQISVYRDARPTTEYHWYISDTVNTLGVDRDHRMAALFPSAFPAYLTSALCKPLIQLFVQCGTLSAGLMPLHAACVSVDGAAVAFSGDSGIGKSTRAAQWVETLGAEWISGDKPLVDPQAGIVYGVPWDGKEQIFRNVRCPLKAILMVERAEKTELIRLPAKVAFAHLIKQAFVPMWDKTLSVKALQALNRMSANIPVYILRCDRTEEAAAETYRMLFTQGDASL